MNENTKTISFIFTAVAVLALAWMFRPAAPPLVTDEMVGKSLFPELDDPLKAKKMRIVLFDEGTSQVREFEVAQANGVWALPSHQNYPADAKDQLASAVSALADLKVLSRVSSDARDAELYGVVEPKPAEDQFGQQGVGKLIVIEDENDKPLARVIIGKEDKPTRKDELAPAESQLRFVRIPGRDQVYRVEMKTDKFSTKFSDWIETDLLKLNPWDIADVKLRDYSVIDAVLKSGEFAQMLNPRADIDVSFDDKTNKWTLKDLTVYKGKKKEAGKLGDDEEVNSTKLNDLKTALSSLKIMDVARKPAQMSANLKAGKEYVDDAASQDLKRRGFHPVPVENNQFDIVSNDGEAVVSMKDGVQYVLRFGEVAGIDSGSDDEKKKTDDSKAEGGKGKAEAAADAGKSSSEKKLSDKPEKSGGLSRYIMVMVQFNPDLLPKPELEALPEIKKAPEKKGEAKSSDAKAGEVKGETKKDGKKDDAKTAAASKDDSDDQEAIEAERDKIEKENRRKQDEYDEKVKKGEQRAKELNARFADWYYVVGDETYRKIHLGQNDIITKKSAEPKDAGHPAIPKNPFDIQGLPGMPGQN
jgi:hypothetical protein